MTARFGIVKWRDPEQRAIIPLDERFRIGKRLAKKLASGYFEVTFDRAFRDVVEACAQPRPGHGSSWSWLSRDLIEAYLALHRLGYAHSAEVWHEGRLVGGEYGVAIGGLYSGESMFTREDSAGRVALAHVVERLRAHGFVLLDTQYLTSVTCEFGAYEVERSEYHTLLADALARDVTF
jgi:leucyl/phenylalanyl-tRNA--protein transferase